MRTVVSKFGRMARWGAPVLLAAAMLLQPASAQARDTMTELRCMALAIYFEARGEPVSGQVAVGHVIMNRLENARFPSTVCGVVKQGTDRRRYRCQFTWYCDGRSDRPRNMMQWYRVLLLSIDIYLGKTQDPTEGALWYHAVYVSPPWRRAFTRGPKIGQHIFYRKPDSTMAG